MRLKLKSFFTVKEAINNNPQNGRKYFQMIQLTKDQCLKIQTAHAALLKTQ